LEKLDYKNKGKLVWTPFISKFLSISKYVIGITVALQVVEFPAKFQNILNKILMALIIFLVTFLLNSAVRLLFRHFQNKESWSSMAKQVFPILSNIVCVFIWIVGIISILSNVGYDVTALITWAGVGWVAIALASQKTIANMFGAVSVILNKPFQVGDFVAIKDTKGTVKEIGLTYLKLISQQGNEIYVPNESLISSTIENLSKREARKQEFEILLDYSNNLEKLKNAVKTIEAILSKEASKDTSKPIVSYRVHIDSLLENAIKICITFDTRIEWIAEHNKLKEKVLLQIYEDFQELSITIGHPL